MLGIILGFGLFIIILYKLFFGRPSRNVCDAPNPKGWPIVGNALQLDITGPMVQLMQWATTYGDVYKLNLLGNTVVVANGEAIDEVLNKKSDEFSGRPYTQKISWLFGGDIGLSDLTPQVAAWRKLFQKFVKQYGTGIRSVEKISLDEIHDLTERIAATNGESFDPEGDFRITVVNIILMLAIGKRFQHDDPIFHRLQLAERYLNESAGAGQAMELDVMPWLRYLNIPSYKRIKAFQQIRDEVVHFMINQSKAGLDRENIRGVVDCLLLAQEDNKGTPMAIPDTNLKMITQDLWAGGTITSLNAVYAMFLVLINHPHAQESVYNELNSVLGSERTPRLDDRPLLPYCEAFVLEVFRYIAHLPLAVPHKAMTDTTLSGYFIPEGTEVWVDLFGLCHDSRYFSDPWSFQPERFLDEDGALKPPQAKERKFLLPFSAGKRVCIGEDLAKARLFLMVTSLVQKFEFQAVDPASPPDCDSRKYILGIVLRANSYQMKAVPRS